MAKEFKDELKSQLEEVKSFCKKNSISVFYGEPELEDYPKVQWDEDVEPGLTVFLETVKNLDQKLLILTTNLNNFEIDDEKVQEHLKPLESDEKASFRKSLDTVFKTEGMIVTYSLSFFREGVCYAYENSADWIYSLNEVMSAHREDEDEETYGGMERINDSERDRLLQIIVQNNNFRQGKTRIDRSIIAEKLLKEEGYDNPNQTYSIAREAETIYLKEIEPLIHEELKEKIQELKAKGFKKIEVRGKLGIGEAALNKFWY